jgi:hypothetical protein
MALIGNVVRVLVYFIVTSGIVGCGQEAKLIRNDSAGYVVAYSIETEADVLSSRNRRKALDIIKGTCPQGERIVKEGEVPKVSQAADRAWRGQMGTDRLWGIQFTCK